MRAHECFKALISSLVRSYRVELRSFACSGPSGGEEIAMTRKVVRSNRMASVALQACTNVVKCFDKTAAFGITVWTILDHACVRQSRHAGCKGVKGEKERRERARDNIGGRRTLYNASS